MRAGLEAHLQSSHNFQRHYEYANREPRRKDRAVPPWESIRVEVQELREVPLPFRLRLQSPRLSADQSPTEELVTVNRLAIRRTLLRVRRRILRDLQFERRFRLLKGIFGGRRWGV